MMVHLALLCGRVRTKARRTREARKARKARRSFTSCSMESRYKSSLTWTNRQPLSQTKSPSSPSSPSSAQSKAISCRSFWMSSTGISTQLGQRRTNSVWTIPPQLEARRELFMFLGNHNCDRRTRLMFLIVCSCCCARHRARLAFGLEGFPSSFSSSCSV